MRIVLDTNVMVSGLINRAGPPGRILDLLDEGLIVAVYDWRMMNEYKDVLGRPGLGFDLLEIQAFLDMVVLRGNAQTAIPLLKKLSDKGDQPFFEVAISGDVQALVTGNLKDYPASHVGRLAVVSPAAFMAAWPNTAR